MNREEEDIGEVGEVKPVDQKREITGVYHIEKRSKSGEVMSEMELPAAIKRKATLVGVLVAVSVGVGGYLQGFKQAADEMEEVKKPIAAHAEEIASVKLSITRVEQGQRQNETDMRGLKEQAAEILRSLRRRR